MSSSLLITNAIKDISTLINEIQDLKRAIYSSSQPSQIESSFNIIQKKLKSIDQKVNFIKIYFSYNKI